MFNWLFRRTEFEYHLGYVCKRGHAQILKNDMVCLKCGFVVRPSTVRAEYRGNKVVAVVATPLESEKGVGF